MQYVALHADLRKYSFFYLCNSKLSPNTAGPTVLPQLVQLSAKSQHSSITQCMQIMTACERKLHAVKNCMQNMCIGISPEEIFINSSIMDQLISCSSCFFSLVMRLRFFSQGNVHIDIGTMPLYRCFKIANLDTPHDQPKFRMQFWHMKMDSHAVSHFMELCCKRSQLNDMVMINALNRFILETV